MVSIESLDSFIYEMLYHLGSFFCGILAGLYQIFRVLAGVEKISVNQSDDFLLSLFFSNSTTTLVFGGMAFLGMAALGILTGLTLLKSRFDLGAKGRMPRGRYKKKILYSFFLILFLNVVVMVAVNVTNHLMQSVEYLTDSRKPEKVEEIAFDEEMYALMAGVFDRIGSYSINPSYKSRYNVNSCFNDIREDLKKLDQAHVFDYTYVTGVNGQESWQSVLTRIARAHGLEEDQPLDQYDQALGDAVLYAMDYVTLNAENMRVLTGYREVASLAETQGKRLDVMLWLSASSNAARNPAFNGNEASFRDPVRSAYLSGEKSIYDLDQVKADFNLEMGSFNHLLVILAGLVLSFEFFMLLLACIVRMCRLLMAYLVAPPFIAAGPFDQSHAFRKWYGAFMVQLMTVLASIVLVRILLFVIPFIMRQELMIAGSRDTGNILKLVLVAAICFAIRKTGNKLAEGLADSQEVRQVLEGAGLAGSQELTYGADDLIKSGRKLSSFYRARKASSRLKKLRKRMMSKNHARSRAAMEVFLAMDPSEAMTYYGMTEEAYEAFRDQVLFASGMGLKEDKGE